MYFARAEPPVAASSAINALPLVTVMTLAAAAVVIAPATKMLAPASKTSNTLNAPLLTVVLETVTVVPLTIPDTLALSLTATILIYPVSADTLVKEILLFFATVVISFSRFSVAYVGLLTLFLINTADNCSISMIGERKGVLLFNVIRSVSGLAPARLLVIFVVLGNTDVVYNSEALVPLSSINED